MASCVIKVCRNYKGRIKTTKIITYHRIPVTPILRIRWVDIIRKSRNEEFWKPAKNSVVCSDHFSEKDMYFVNQQQRRRLKKGAVPRKALFLSSLQSDGSCGSDEDVVDTRGQDVKKISIKICNASKSPANTKQASKAKQHGSLQEFGNCSSGASPTKKQKLSDEETNSDTEKSKQYSVANIKKYSKDTNQEEFEYSSSDDESPTIKQEPSDEETNSDNDKSKQSSVANKKKQSKDGQTRAKRARLGTTEDLHFDYSEELYEFGKFVAEQLMCLDVEEACVAQTEIRELLSKFNRNKVMRCFAEPSTSKVHPATDVTLITTESQAIPLSSLTQLVPKVITGSSVTQYVFTKENSMDPSMTESSLQVTQSSSQKIADPLMSQSGSLLNPKITQTGQIIQPPLTNYAVLNMYPDESHSTQIGYVIVPGPIDNSTPCNTERTLGIQHEPVSSVKSTVTQSGSANIVSGTSEPDPFSLNTYTQVFLPNVAIKETIDIKVELDSDDET